MPLTSLLSFSRLRRGRVPLLPGHLLPLHEGEPRRRPHAGHVAGAAAGLKKNKLGRRKRPWTSTSLQSEEGGSGGGSHREMRGDYKIADWRWANSKELSLDAEYAATWPTKYLILRLNQLSMHPMSFQPSNSLTLHEL